MKITTPRPGLISPPRQPAAEAPQAAAMPIAKRRIGIDRITSIVREMSVSSLPPK